MTEEYTIRSDLTVSGDDIVINNGAITIFPRAGHVVMTVTAEGKRIILPFRADLAMVLSERLDDAAADLVHEIVEGFYGEMDRAIDRRVLSGPEGPDRSVDKVDGDRGCP